MTTLKTLALGLNRFLSRLFSDDPETIDYLNGADSLPPPLNKEEEKKAFELLETDPKKARELLIVHNLRLVVYIAKKFESTGTGIEDLISIGSIGLIKAVNTFRPDKKIRLATYASRCIENAILSQQNKRRLRWKTMNLLGQNGACWREWESAAIF